MKFAIRTLLMAGIYSMTLLSGQTIDSFTVKPSPNWTSARMSDPSGQAFANPVEISGVPGPVQNCGAGIITNCCTSRVVTTGYASNGMGVRTTYLARPGDGCLWRISGHCLGMARLTTISLRQLALFLRARSTLTGRPSL